MFKRWDCETLSRWTSKTDKREWSGIWGLYKRLKCLGWVVFNNFVNYSLFLLSEISFLFSFYPYDFQHKGFISSLIHFYSFSQPLASLISQSLSSFFLSQDDRLLELLSTLCSDFFNTTLKLPCADACFQKALGQTQWPFSPSVDILLLQFPITPVDPVASPPSCKKVLLGDIIDSIPPP